MGVRARKVLKLVNKPRQEGVSPSRTLSGFLIEFRLLFPILFELGKREEDKEIEDRRG